MNTLIKSLLAIVLLSAVAAVGYLIGSHKTVATATHSAAPAERKVLYYRNPMGLPDTSPVPKKDSMGMDYVAVYEGEEQSGTALVFSTDKVQKMGVQSEAATMRILDQRLRVTGRIAIDEQRTYMISPKFSGWVEQLYVNSTGQAVKKGQMLFDVYSPDLVTAQREHELALQGLLSLQGADAETRAGMQRLVDASHKRLQNWDIQNGTLHDNRIRYQSPVNGIVLEKKAIQGMRFMPGEVLYQIADLSQLWIIADVPEQQIAGVKVGDIAHVEVEAYPGKSYEAKVDFIYPTLNTATRTVPVRLLIANAQGRLKPEMYAQVELSAGLNTEVLTVPNSAVIDSGTRQVVLVQLAAGRFEPRTVKLGARSSAYVQVLEGVVAGEQVVTSANFLIDAESNLRAALSGMSGSPQTASATVATAKPADAAQHKHVAHQGHGTLDGFNDDGTVSITHEAISTLGWPGMTMDFALANTSLGKDIKVGATIDFELVERGEGEWVITKLQAAHGGH